MTKAVGLGAGGHAKVVIEILRLTGHVECVALLDPDERLWNGEVLGVPVLGGDRLLSDLFAQGVTVVFMGIGATSRTSPRQKLYQLARSLGFGAATAIHPSAVISPSAQIGRGPTIMAGAIVNAQARIGENVIINSGAIVEHDCVIGDHAHVSPGARLAGRVQVGDGTHIGLGACVRDWSRIGRNVTVGAGAVVVGDVADDSVVVGVPAKPIARSPNR